ncbi:MAG TPA: ABC transporter permease, partial [Pyrinomonadaceae bacterium]
MISAQTARRAVWRPLRDLPRHFGLISSLTRREIAARYKGSVLGIVWAVLTPVVTIAMFTLIFAGLFGARFGASGSVWEFALYLFCGLLPWGAFQEAVQVSSQKIVSQANLVKRVVFPLEILPVAQSLASLANQLFGTIALLIMAVIIQRTLRPTILWLP